MSRLSVETAKSVINSLLSEQERDREYLQRMMVHSEKMTEHLVKMRDEEESRIDAEAAERKSALRRMFAQLLTVEEERRQRLEQHLADLNGISAQEGAATVTGGDMRKILTARQ
jgi:hypothetical protein